MNYNKIFSESELEQIKSDYINNQLSYKEIAAKYNIRSKSFIQKLLGNKSRSVSEANRLARRKYPERFRHTEESKQKIREARLRYMREHPENTAWKLSNYSYPEQQFIKFLNKYKYTEQYQIIREYSIFPYFIDFAFPDQKLAVEIDGSQHLLPERKQKDLEKDKILISQGWKVIRITENLVKTNWEIIYSTLQRCLKETIPSTNSIGIFTHQGSRYKRKIKGTDGLTDLQRIAREKQKAKSVCPNKDILEELIKSKTAKEIAILYKVSDVTVGKWLKKLKIPHKTRGGKVITY